MPRYVVERIYELTDESELEALSVRSKLIAIEQFPDIAWEHSHVVVDDVGTIRSFCVYRGPSAERLVEHAEAFGGHRVEHVYEIVEDVTPDDVE